MRHIVILPDVQVPFEDVELMKKFIGFLEAYQPDKVASVGDFTDCTALGRWVSGSVGEYSGGLQDEFDRANAWLTKIRAAVGDAEFIMQRSNHADRLQKWLRTKGAAVHDLRDLTIEKQLNLKDHGVQYCYGDTAVAPGWLIKHGDEGSTSQIGGQTAALLAQRHGKSVVCGHTHRGGIVPVKQGWIATTYGMEVGCFMDPSKASYLTAPSGWTNGFGILHVGKDNKTFAEYVQVVSRGFVVDGTRF
jgi:UDP-2,3-diacylglucosamine pyrophosphatase LpxH